MTQAMKNNIQQYVSLIHTVYGNHLRQVIMYGSYARGDYDSESDIDIMILVDISDVDIKKYRHKLSDVTFDFNMENEMDIKPIAKNIEQYKKWVDNYPFYANVNKEGVTLYAA